ncbi:MAG: glycosyltransferase [Candidatus Pacebacteria bacterium]|nr:glycosyltransferase [Candidatus Paceibacterota bacterium]
MLEKKKKQKRKHVLVIGSYDESYPRNEVLLKALESCYKLKQYTFLKQKLSHISFAKTLIRNFFWMDAVLVMWPARTFWFVLVLLRIFYRKKIIVDAFNSDYETTIIDRQLTGKSTIKAWYLFSVETILFRIADILFFDTVEHRDYMTTAFHLPEKVKKIVLPVSVDVGEFEIITKQVDVESSREKIHRIVFAGYFIPVQGIEYIVQAAHILRERKDIQFTVIGAGQMSKEIYSLAEKLNIKNIVFIPRISYKELKKHYVKADVILGIFGISDKADRVIPNKVIEGMASGKTVITGENTSMRQMFSDKEDILFCKRGNAEDLARVIEYAVGTALCEEIGKDARKKIEEQFSLVFLKQKICAII